jgi:methanogenic corrinoid protein MtbC1
MLKQHTLERYLQSLLIGNRPACRAVIEETLRGGVPANNVYMDVIWPIMVEIDKLYGQDGIDSAQQAFATRINRTIVDQLQNKLPRKPQRSKKIVVCCSANQQAELGGQMITDLFESDGWEARFLGGDVNNDDILAFVHSYHPDILLLYGIGPKAAPQVRKLIDTIKIVNAWPDMKIMLSGGVFDRADGLWEEIGADLYAATAAEAVRVASAEASDIPKPQRTIKCRKTKNAKATETTPQTTSA